MTITANLQPGPLVTLTFATGEGGGGSQGQRPERAHSQGGFLTQRTPCLSQIRASAPLKRSSG